MEVPSKFHGVPPRPYMFQHEPQVFLTLVDLVQPKTVIEFGVNEGLTAQMTLQWFASIKNYIGVDVPKSYETEIAVQRGETPNEPGILVKDDLRFKLVLKSRGTFDAKADLPKADLIFIDGDHGYNAVLHDSDLAFDLINSGGMIIWHDYGNAQVQVTAALDFLGANGWNMKSVDGTWLAFERF